MKIAFITLCINLLCWQFAQAQTIKNAGFQSGNLTGWTFTNPAYYHQAKEPGYTVSVVKDAFRKGGYVARVSSTGHSQWGQLKQNVVYKPTDTLEKMRLSAYVKLKDIKTGSAGMMVRALGGGSDFGISEKSLRGTTGWTYISTEFIVPKQTDSLLVFCSISGAGEVLFDDIRLEKIKSLNFEQSPQARAYLDTALSIIDRYALYKDSVDFKSLIKTAHDLAIDAKKPADTYSAIQYVLKGLHDRHSFFITPERLATDEDTTDIPMPTGKLINGNIGYVTVPSFGFSDKILRNRFADSLHRIIKSLDSESIAGWIVDDRNNNGGQPWPMLLGVGPLLGNGVFDKHVKKGVVIDSISYHDGAVSNKDSVIMKIGSPYSLYKPYPKVAVLINRNSASASEMVALSFKNRPKAKLFGEPTYGISTVPHFEDLSDGALLTVFKGRQTDRLGNEYGGKIFPDVAVSDQENTANDEVIDAAVKWLTGNK